MTKYVVESAHTPEECMQALDETLKKGEEVLKQFAFGSTSASKPWIPLFAVNFEACYLSHKYNLFE